MLEAETECAMSRFAPSAVVLALSAAPALAQTIPIPPRPELYRFVMIQAAPGRLPDLIELYRQRVPVIVAGGDEEPIFIRHSQGDRWDLLVIFPSGSFPEYYSAARLAKREAAANAVGLSGAAFLQKMYDVIAWHEDVFVQGPPLAELRAYLTGNTLAHLEMMQVLPGKRDELVRQRHMESAYNVWRGRPGMLVFTHEQGAAWEVITLDAWRDWRQYGELQMIPADVSDAAAKKAGFANADAVGVYMRSLISTHHDSLGPIVSFTR
jgi:hypothetical protein